MSVSRNLNREQLRRFVKYWDKLLQAVPEARREAMKAAGEAVKRSLDTQIQTSNFSSIEAKGRVKSWQALRLGSGGGWAAVSAMKKSTVYSFDSRRNFGGRYRQHTWKGKPVSAGQVTTWLERGHGTGTTGQIETVLTKRKWIHQRKERGGLGYVAGRQFYAYTKDDAQEIALKAADKVLCRIADEVDF